MPARDYQIDCLNAVLTAWGEAPWHASGDTFRSVLVNLTTSAGKTYIAGMLINEMRSRGKCLFLADTDELCDQPFTKFTRQFGMRPWIEKASDRASMHADVVVASAQTLQRKERLQRFAPDHFGYVFVDEAHRGSDRNKAITDHFSGAKVMGMTATPFRAKLANLSAYYEHVAFELGMFDLIGAGYIAPIKVLTLPLQVDISKVHQKAGDYDAEELETTIRPYYEEICRLVLENAHDRQIVVFLPLIRSSQDFVKIAQGFDISARHIDGTSPDREQILRAFENREFQMLCNSSLLTTGWDCPPCDCLLNLAPTRSMGMFRQKVGRIGRLLPGVIEGLNTAAERKAAIAASAKPDALILDLLWQTEKFGLMGPADLIATNAEQRAAIQKKLKGLSSAEDLEDIAARVQIERERALKRALIEAAKKAKRWERNTGMLDATLVATVLGAHKLVDYEPVMKWQRKDATEEQLKLLAKFQVDPASVKDKGHATAMITLLLGRLREGKARFLTVQALEERQFAEPWRYTENEAYEILGGYYPMPFGKRYLGCGLRQIPSSYWRWCAEQPWIEKKFPTVWNWMQSVIDPAAERVWPPRTVPDPEPEPVPQPVPLGQGELDFDINELF